MLSKKEPYHILQGFLRITDCNIVNCSPRKKVKAKTGQIYYNIYYTIIQPIINTIVYYYYYFYFFTVIDNIVIISKLSRKKVRKNTTGSFLLFYWSHSQHLTNNLTI